MTVESDGMRRCSTRLGPSSPARPNYHHHSGAASKTGPRHRIGLDAERNSTTRRHWVHTRPSYRLQSKAREGRSIDESDDCTVTRGTGTHHTSLHHQTADALLRRGRATHMPSRQCLPYHTDTRARRLGDHHVAVVLHVEDKRIGPKLTQHG